MVKSMVAEYILMQLYYFFIADRDSAFAFLNKIERTISKDKQAVVRVRTGQIELRLMHKDSKDRCVDIQIVRVLIMSSLRFIFMVLHNCISSFGCVNKENICV